MIFAGHMMNLSLAEKTFPLGRQSQRKTPWGETDPRESTTKSRPGGNSQLTTASMMHWINSLMFIIRRILYSIVTSAAPGSPGHVQLGWASNWGAGQRTRCYLIPPDFRSGSSPVENFFTVP